MTSDDGAWPPSRRNGVPNISVVAQEPLSGLFRPPMRRHISEQSHSLRSALNWSAEHYDVPIRHEGATGPIGADKLTKQIEAKVEDLIFKEIADWLDLNDHDWHWALRRRHLQQLVSSSNDSEVLPLHLASALDIATEAPEATLYFIAVQLLAACYTMTYDPAVASLPASLYHERKQLVHISTLRSHAQYRFSPASGTHPREPSFEPAWPGLFDGPSPEDRRVDEVTRRRLLKQLDMDAHKVETMEEFIHWCNDSPLEPEEVSLSRQGSQWMNGGQHRSSSPETYGVAPGDKLEWLQRARTAGPAHFLKSPSQRRFSSHPSTFPPAPGTPHHRASTYHRRMSNIADVLRRKRHDTRYKWKVKPVIRADPHPLFVQPMRQLRLRRSRSVPRLTRDVRSSIDDWAGKVTSIASAAELVPEGEEEGYDEVDGSAIQSPNEMLTAQEYLAGTAFDDSQDSHFDLNASSVDSPFDHEKMDYFTGQKRLPLAGSDPVDDGDEFSSSIRRSPTQTSFGTILMHPGAVVLEASPNTQRANGAGGSSSEGSEEKRHREREFL